MRSSDCEELQVALQLIESIKCGSNSCVYGYRARVSMSWRLQIPAQWAKTIWFGKLLFYYLELSNECQKCCETFLFADVKSLRSFLKIDDISFRRVGLGLLESSLWRHLRLQITHDGPHLRGGLFFNRASSNNLPP